jgi:hypothetical protein
MKNVESERKENPKWKVSQQVEWIECNKCDYALRLKSPMACVDFIFLTNQTPLWGVLHTVANLPAAHKMSLWGIKLETSTLGPGKGNRSGSES